MRSIASLSEWLFWVFTFGAKQPELRKSDIEFLARDCRFDISKAKERLGYRPLMDQEEGIKIGVRSVQEREAIINEK